MKSKPPGAGGGGIHSVPGYGGSNPGRDVRPWPKHIKLAVLRWATQVIGGGSETVMWLLLDGRKDTKRFSPSYYQEAVVPLLELYFPAEYEALFGMRVTKSGVLIDDRYDRAGNCTMNRIHKMYYWNNGVQKARLEASWEHPKHWPQKVKAECEAKILAAGWPW